MPVFKRPRVLSSFPPTRGVTSDKRPLHHVSEERLGMRAPAKRRPSGKAPDDPSSPDTPQHGGAKHSRSHGGIASISPYPTNAQRRSKRRRGKAGFLGFGFCHRISCISISGRDASGARAFRRRRRAPPSRRRMHASGSLESRTMKGGGVAGSLPSAPPALRLHRGIGRDAGRGSGTRAVSQALGVHPGSLRLAFGIASVRIAGPLDRMTLSHQLASEVPSVSQRTT